MDTTPKYIKMCEQAKEIQALWGHEAYDLFTYLFPESPIYSEPQRILSPAVPGYIDMLKHDGAFWLPRQDQLQLIFDPEVNGEIFDISTMLYKFHCFLDERYDYCVDFIMSWEQSWLAFVMKKNFNKTWNNEKEVWECLN